MNTRKINGLHMEKMLRNGLNNLRMNEEKLNRLNVFPVADGDTGTNMRITLESGIRGAGSNAAMAGYLKALSGAMLYGARGNSGVILSQIIKGYYLALCRCGSAGVLDIKNALVSGYKTAYAAVLRPVEGTVLTVAREGIEHIRSHIDRSTTVEDLLNMYLIELRRSLSSTTDTLPQLREAGVVDSGAMGYILIVEGMLKYLNGEVLPESGIYTVPANSYAETDVSLFNENTVFQSGYCLEFILQLMNGRAHFALERFKTALGELGGSVAAVQSGKRIKVHIHTMNPARVLGLAQSYGEFVTCKLENMQLQHNSLNAPLSMEQKPRRGFAILTAADTEQTEKLFRDMGGEVIGCGEKMSLSVQDFLDAIRNANAEKLAILPNNGELVRVAEQAARLASDCKVTVIPTESLPQGYVSLAMDVADEKNVETRIRRLMQGMSGVVTVLAESKGKPEADTESFFDKLMSCPEAQNAESCTVFRGTAADEALENTLRERISETLPELEISFLFGGSSRYTWTAALS